MIFAFQHKPDRACHSQMRHFDYIAQFITNIRHVEGPENTVADALLELKRFFSLVEYKKQNLELQDFLSDKSAHGLNLLPMNPGLHCTAMRELTWYVYTFH